ncbi:MAG: 16S rRNA (uracil(1498)-N(3))-methyltransferase [Alphaproteobacteria bacterium]|nr:16S rRNA (uracil(1498)-N(3))-methyltransferase [Alphaproteobacteria bacterium]
MDYMTRLYLNASLFAREQILLSVEQSHYIARVLRFQKGDAIHMFNERDGEWSAEITEGHKKQVIVELKTQVRVPKPTAPLWLAFSIIKHDPLMFMIEKATELGVTHLQPLIADRCNTHKANEEKLYKNALEATQQCERLDVPTVLPGRRLDDFIRALPNDICWFVAFERSDAQPLVSALQKIKPTACGFIIGPEGGFSPAEKDLLSRSQNIHPITLGPRILRSETAAISSLAICLGMLGE